MSKLFDWQSIQGIFQFSRTGSVLIVCSLNLTSINERVFALFILNSLRILRLVGQSEPTKFGRWVQWTSVLMAGVLDGGF